MDRYSWEILLQHPATEFVNLDELHRTESASHLQSE
jgi:hypothetical protein